MSKSSGNSQSIFRRIMKIKEVSILIPLILICVITTIGNSSFLYPDNIISLLRSVSLTTIGALGMSFVYGRQVLAVGGNKETARVSGINVQRIEISTYVVAGFAAALVGLLTASRLATAQSNAGDGWEMTLIASAVIGGTSLFGGNFTAIGTVIGVGIMEVLTVATTLLKVDTYYQKIIVGVIIILAVGIDMAQRKRRERG